MIVHRRSPAVWVFGVDDSSVQVCWRLLQPGTLMLRCEGARLELEVDGAPGAATLAGLPAGRLLTIDASGSALAEPRQLAARTLQPLGGEPLCRIATISDLHLGAETFGHWGGIVDRSGHAVPHPRRCADAAVDEAVAWGAERILAKGDLTNYALPEQWRDYAEVVRRCPVPVDAIPGNHDHAPHDNRASVLPPDAARAFGLSIADPLLVRDHPGLRVILVDSTRPARHGGTLAPVLADLLDAVAETPTDHGVLVALHQQLQPNRLPEAWPVGVPRDESFAVLDQLGRAHPHVVVTSGHTHRNRRWGRAGVVVTQVGSTKDYPGVWAGYQVDEGGMRQIVRRIEDPACIGWTDHSRIAAFGLWEHTSPGRLDARCFNVGWSSAACR